MSGVSPEQENVRIVKEMYSAFDRGDIPAIIDKLADDVEFCINSIVTDVPWYGIHKGPAAVRDRFFGSIAKEADVRVFERKDFIASGNQVVVTWHGEYTLKRNGKKVLQEGAHLWTFNPKGKVSRYRGFVDTAADQAAWRG